MQNALLLLLRIILVCAQISPLQRELLSLHDYKYLHASVIIFPYTGFMFFVALITLWSYVIYLILIVYFLSPSIKHPFIVMFLVLFPSWNTFFFSHLGHHFLTFLLSPPLQTLHRITPRQWHGAKEYKDASLLSGSQGQLKPWSHLREELQMRVLPGETTKMGIQCGF